MKNQLDHLINQTLEKLQMLGMKQSTIKSYRYSAFNRVRNYCIRQGVTTCHPETLCAFLSIQQRRLENDEISQRYFRKLRKAVQMLQEFSQKGEIHWHCHHEFSRCHVNDYFRACLKQFLEKQRVGERTIAQIQSSVLQFLNHLENNGHIDFNEMSPKDVEDYLLLVAPKHRGSMGYVLYVMRLFLGYLKEYSFIPVNFLPLLSTPVQRKKRVLPCFTREEVDTILQQIDQQTMMGKRDYAILLLASRTGLRGIDIATLQLKDLDWFNNTIHIVQRKTGQALTLPLEAEVGNAIAAYILKGRPESDSTYIFLRAIIPYKRLSETGAVGPILEKYRKKAGIKRTSGDGKSFHALRRSIGTWMLESGVPLTTISQVLGHRNQNSAKQYLSMDHQRLFDCALNFKGIPVEGGLYR